ncbi:SLC13 family permease [Actinoplanes sp. NPDC051859]|uniref:SLC13 family permease n=1 Tax=Actinoplanes sp. NPDC051859 TaxID=3363909 RepID=UPI0037B694D8
MTTVVSLVLLAGVLGFAVARPARLPEAVAAVPAAVIAVVAGLVPWRDAVHELAELGPTVGFLAAVLLLAYLADESGVFRYAGAVAARWSRGSAQRLFGMVFILASVVTAALSLDATVVLLTPVVFATAVGISAQPTPHVYACNHLANSASLLLPVSNLTNLLAMSAASLSFLAFAGLMALPWLAVIAVEYLILRRYFATDLRPSAAPAGGGGAQLDPAAGGCSVGPAGSAAGGCSVGPAGSAAGGCSVGPAGSAAGGCSVGPAGSAAGLGHPADVAAGGGGRLADGARPAAGDAGTPSTAGVRVSSPAPVSGASSELAVVEPGLAVPRFALVVLGVTLAGFAVAGPWGVHPAWVALAGALTLAVRRKERVGTLVRKANPGFCLFVLALGVVVLAVSRSGLGTLIGRVTPDHANLVGLLLMAGLAAVLANLLNNLPATLLLLPLAESSPGLVLAVLLGANIGPNLTYVGSLATLLWRQILHGRGQPPVAREFLRLGALTVPACLAVGVLMLWVSLRVTGL